jgi:NAD(P)-dependent dehydrogenase (short-subunit alcohol dehydrogenase family)
MPRLQDKVAFSTGAARGLGRALALTMAREGADVIVSA